MYHTIYQFIEKCRSSDVFKNIIYSFSSKGVAMVFYFLLDISIARILGFTLYDEWSFFYAIVTMANWIIRFGVDSSCKVHIAKAEGSKAVQGRYLKEAVKVQLFIGLLFVGLVATCVWGLGVNSLKYPHLSGLLVIGAFWVAFYGMLCLFKESTIGYINFKFLFLTTSVEFSMYFLMGIAGTLTMGIYGLAVGYGVACLVAVLYSGKKMSPLWKLSTQDKQIKFRCRKQLLGYAFIIFLGNIGGIVMTEMDSFMLGMLSNQEVGIYSIGKNIISKATNVPLALSISTMTTFAIINTENSEEKKKKYKNLLLLASLLLLMMGAILGVAGPHVITLVYGQVYRKAGKILRLLIVYFVLYGLSIFLSTFINYRKMGKEMTISTILLVILNLLFNCLLIPGYGAEGAAVATCLAMVPYVMLLAWANLKVFKGYSGGKLG